MDFKFLLTASVFMMQHKLKLGLQKCETKIKHLDELPISKNKDQKRLLFAKEELQFNERIGNVIKNLQNKKKLTFKDGVRLNMIRDYHTKRVLLIARFVISL